MVNEHFTIKFKHIYLSNTQLMKNIFNQYFPINTHINPTFYNQCQSISQLCTIPILNQKIHSFQYIIVISKYISTSLNEVHKHFVHFEMTVSTFQFISTFPFQRHKIFPQYTIIIIFIINHATIDQFQST